MQGLTDGDWLQALFSAAAILAGFVGIIVQHALERTQLRRDERRQLREVRESLLSLLNAFGASLRSVSEQMSSDIERGDDTDVRFGAYLIQVNSIFEPYRAFMERFEITTIASATVWLAWAELRQATALAADQLTARSERPINPPDFSLVTFLLAMVLLKLEVTIAAVRNEA